MERHAITFDDLVGLHRLDHVELGGGPTPLEGIFFNLISDVGRFTVPVQGSHLRVGPSGHLESTPIIDPDGFWEPEVTAVAPIPLLIMCRFAPTNERRYTRMYCTDEATGLVVLEFGSSTRADDPNQRYWREGVFRWEAGAGWDSPFLVEPDPPDGIEIKRTYAFTPKRVGASPRKGRF